MTSRLFELLFWRTVEVYVSVLDWEDRSYFIDIKSEPYTQRYVRTLPKV